jgi:type II secretory pathway pseudopilin PulG
MSRNSINSTNRWQQGFSLIELMVSLVAGMIVIGAILAFTVSSLQANTEYVQATRLTHELRNVIDYTSRDLRRAGFDQAFLNQLSQVSGSGMFSSFAPIEVVDGGTDSSCIIYAYDRQPFDPDTTAAGAVDLVNGEVRGIRRVVATIGGQDVGVIEVAQSVEDIQPDCADTAATYTSYPASCDDDGVWCPFTDPRAIDVEVFRVVYTASDIDAPTSDSVSMRIREFDVSVRGSLRNSDVVRSVRTSIRVRSDCVRADLDECDESPVGI